MPIMLPIGYIKMGWRKLFPKKGTITSEGGRMNANLKLAASLLSGLMFYAILTLGVWYKWWLPDVLLTAIYGGMTAAGLTGGIHYGARYLTYTKPDHVPDAGKMVPISDHIGDTTGMVSTPTPSQATQEIPQ